ncbi:S8 family serine peptidase, partial [Salibacteraceae bacterium]|nr:S8 family serine peptidase [Salibacteraceae bacterium]
NSGTSNCGYGAGNVWGNITGGHKVGKNVIAVANLTSYDVVATSSSRGPAHDGRIKPDVSAKGWSQILLFLLNTPTSIWAKKNKSL